MTLAEADNLPAGVDSYTLVDSVDGLWVPMPVDLATADLLMGANNGLPASAISVSDDLTAINSYGSVSSFGSVTATDVTLTEAGALPAGVGEYTLVDSVDGLQVPVPVDLATADLLMGANNGPSAYAISVSDDLSYKQLRLRIFRFFSVTATDVTLAEAGALPAGVDGYTLVDSVDGLQAPMPVNVEDALVLLGASNGLAPGNISVADDASSLGASIDFLGYAGMGPFALTGGTTAPISLDQMLQLERAFDQFPPEVLISVEDTAEKILEFFVSADEDERLSVADADTLTATGGAPISFSGLDTLLAIDDFDAGASNFTVAAAAAEVQGRVSSDLQQLLDLPITIDVTDRETVKVTLDVTELDGLGVKIVDTPNSVNLVDSVSAITGYGGTVSVNRVTFEAESDGQDLTGIDFNSYYGQQPANLSTNDHTNVQVSADQLGTEIVGTGTYHVTGDHGANNGVGSTDPALSNTGSVQVTGDPDGDPGYREGCLDNASTS